MAVKDILRMGNPLLYRVAEPVEEFASNELKQIIQDMLDTAAAVNGLGIAAPQIGINKRIVVFGFEKSERYPNEAPIPTTILINPEISMSSAEKTAEWEGCLSVPHWRGVVERYTTIRCLSYNLQGEKVEIEATGMHARIIQHEVDHLDGILFPMRVKDLRLLGYEQEVWDWVLKREVPTY